MKKGKKNYSNRIIFDSAPLSLWIGDFSRAKRALDALAQQEIRDFRNFFDTHPERLQEISDFVRILDVNPFTLKLFNAQTKETFLHSIPDTFPEESSPPYREILLAIAEGKTHLEFETVYRKLDGSLFPCKTHWSAFPYPKVDTDLALIALTDISSLKKMEQALEESEALYRALVEQSLVGVYLFDKDKFLYVNEALANMMGYSQEEIIGRIHPLDLTLPEDRAAAAEKITERLEGKTETARYTFRGFRKDSKEFYCEVFGRGITYKHRPAILGTIIDITEKVAVEKILREKMASLSLLNTIGKAFVSESSIKGIMENVLPLIRDESHADVAFLYHQERNQLVLLGAAPVNLSQKHIRMIKNGICICGKAMAQRTALYVNNLLKDKRYELNFCHKTGITSFAALPLISGNLAVGLLGLGWKGNLPQEKIHAFYENIVDYLALGLQNALLFAETKRQAADLEEKIRARTDELQRMVNLMAGREIRMMELKEVIRKLREQIRQLGVEPIANDPLNPESP